MNLKFWGLKGLFSQMKLSAPIKYPNLIFDIFLTQKSALDFPEADFLLFIYQSFAKNILYIVKKQLKKLIFWLFQITICGIIF